MDSNNALTWLSFADADIDTAELLRELRPMHFEIICYHCEQAVEKYLKGFLVAQGGVPPKIRDLEQLCALCSEKNKSFDEIAKTCNFLTPFAVQARYPNEMPITEQHAKQAISYAEIVRDFVPIVNLRDNKQHSTHQQ